MLKTAKMLEPLYFFADVDYFGFVDDFGFVEAALSIFVTFLLSDARQGKRLAMNGSTILFILDTIDSLFGYER